MKPETPAMIRYNRVFNCSDECQGGWIDCVCSSARLDYIRDSATQAQACEQAAADDFLQEIDI